MWVHRYTLTPKRALSAIAAPGPRQGALIRIGDGVADLHRIDGEFRHAALTAERA
jgi:hypothetical protein